MSLYKFSHILLFKKKKKTPKIIFFLKSCPEKKKLCIVKQEKNKKKQNKNKTKNHAQGPNKSKEKSKKKKKTNAASQESKATQQNPGALHMGNLFFYLLDILPPSFLPILERKLFGRPRKKTPGPHRLFPFSTPQPNIVQNNFPSHFLYFFFPSSLKSTLPNTLLNTLIHVYLIRHQILFLYIFQN